MSFFLSSFSSWFIYWRFLCVFRRKRCRSCGRRLTRFRSQIYSSSRFNNRSCPCCRKSWTNGRFRCWCTGFLTSFLRCLWTNKLLALLATVRSGGGRSSTSSVDIQFIERRSRYSWRPIRRCSWTTVRRCRCCRRDGSRCSRSTESATSSGRRPFCVNRARTLFLYRVLLNWIGLLLSRSTSFETTTVRTVATETVSRALCRFRRCFGRRCTSIWFESSKKFFFLNEY